MRIGNRIVGLTALLAVGIISSLAMFSVAHAASVCDSISGNLVSNCGFESDPGGTNVPTGWALTDGQFGFTNGASAHSGDWGYFLDQARRLNPLVLSQSIATVPGDRYQVSFWSSSGFDPFGRDSLDVTFGGVPAYSQASNGLGGDTKVERSFILLAVLSATDLAFSARTHTNPIELDDISVVDLGAPTPIPAALSLFASGVGALGFAGWRRKRQAAA